MIEPGTIDDLLVVYDDHEGYIVLEKGLDCLYRIAEFQETEKELYSGWIDYDMGYRAKRELLHNEKKYKILEKILRKFHIMVWNT